MDEPETENPTPVAPPEEEEAPKRKYRRKSSGVLARLTAYEIQERRQHVGRLRTQGLGLVQIAKVLNLSEFTVERDLKAYQEDNARRISTFEKEKYLGQSMANFERIREEAWTRYYGAKEDRHKLKALDVLLSIEKEQTSMLMETGIISKPKEEPAHVEHKHTLQLDWSETMKKRVAEALLQQSLHSTLAEPTPELSAIAIREAEVVTSKTETVEEEKDDETSRE
jgi:hypothetical protein